MTNSTKIANALNEGLDELSDLAKEEYHSDLGQLLANAQDDASLQPFVRLIGIALKQPFAYPVDIAPSQSATGAYRTWQLDHYLLQSQEARQSWQHAVLDRLKTEKWIGPERGSQPATVEDLAWDAHYERGFWWYIAKSTLSHICGDQILEQRLQAAVDEVNAKGGTAALIARDSAVATLASTVAGILIQGVPWLGLAAPVLTGIVIVICNIGIDGFCDWAKNRLKNPEQVP